MAETEQLLSTISVLVTGSSSGIGYATAVHLAQKGVTVFATVRKATDAERLAALGIPGLIPLYPFDLRVAEQITVGMRRVESELADRGLSGLQALVNNAGGGGPAPIELLPLPQLRAQLETRIFGAVALVQAALPLLRRGNGRIVWIATPAIIPTPYVASIHACDFAVNCIARTLNVELKRWNIANIMIRCGGVRTPAGMRTVDDAEALLRTVESDRSGLYEEPLRRWAHQMISFDTKRVDAIVVARTIERAIIAKRPRSRYSVGHLAGLAAFLELLPQQWSDAILRARFA